MVAIDGPSGSGKSTAARALATALGAAYLDTGATYRAVCWWGLEHHVPATAGAPAHPPSALARAAATMDLQVGTDPAAPRVLVGGAEVTQALRTARVSAAVSAVATDLGVRAALVARQRAILADAAARGPVVLEGRDTTTVVAPTAAVRVLLVADPRARVARRARERHGSTGAKALAATAGEVTGRDARDATVADFATAAPGVTTVDGTDLSVEATVAALAALVARAKEQR